MSKYVEVISLQEEAAEYPLELIRQYEPEQAVQYLAQWDNGADSYNWSNKLPLQLNSCERLYQSADQQYIVVYSPTVIGYISLYVKVE